MVEILAVVIVLGLLAGVAVPQYLSQRSRARVAAVASDARNLGALIEDAWAKDRRYPDTLDAGASEVPGSKLSPNNRVAQYAATANGFTLCLIYTEGASAKAYARYDSNNGGLVGKGTGDGGTVCDPTAPPAPVLPPTDPGGGGGGGGGGAGGGAEATDAPTNVKVDAVPGEFKATVTWDAVSGATGYAVFLDGASTPAWTGADPTTVLTGLAKGLHEVAVRATKSGGDTTAKSDAVAFTIYGDNDFLANAHPIPTDGAKTWHSTTYNNATATAETGEPGTNRRGLWWFVTVPRDTSYTFTPVAPVSGTALTNPTVAVFKTTTTDPASLGTPMVSSYDSVTIAAQAGATYKVRISDSCGCTNYYGPFRLRVIRGPDNDALMHAETITGLNSGVDWFSPDVDNSYAGPEPSEPGTNRRSVWWTLTVPRDAYYTFRPVVPAGGGTALTNPTVAVWKTTTTDVTALGTAVVSNYDQATIDGRTGEIYKIRVSDSCGCTNYFGLFRLKVTPGPGNDSLVNADEVTGLSAGTAWYSPTVDNTMAGAETGEPGTSRRSLWWTLTVPRDATYNFGVATPASGGTALTNPRVGVWKTSTTSVTTLGTAALDTYDGGQVAAKTGEILKIRISDSCGCTNYYGPFRLRVTPGPGNDSLSQAAVAPDVAAGGTWHSPDVDNTWAGAEPGETGTSRRSMWWTFTPSRSGTYVFRSVAPSTGAAALTNPQMAVFTSTSTDVTALGAALTSAYDQVSINATAGQTYKIRTADPCGCTNYYGLYRLRVTG